MASSLAPGQVRPRLEGRFGTPLYLYAERCSSTQDLLPLDAPEGALAARRGADARAGTPRARSGRAKRKEPALLALPAPGGRDGRLCFAHASRPRRRSSRRSRRFGGEATVKDPNDVLTRGKEGGRRPRRGERRPRRPRESESTSGQQASELPSRPVFPASSLALELGAPPDRVELLVQILAAARASLRALAGRRRPSPDDAPAPSARAAR